MPLLARSTAPAAALKDLQRIPGIGPSLAADLVDLGVRRVADLRRRNPERLYEMLIALRADTVCVDIPVIVLSARGNEEHRLRMLQAGAQDYLVKPFSPEELQIRLGNLLKISQVEVAQIHQVQGAGLDLLQVSLEALIGFKARRQDQLL